MIGAGAKKAGINFVGAVLVSFALALAPTRTAAASEGDFFFLETFQGADPLSRWSFSKKDKYADQPVSVTKVSIPGFEDEKTLILEEQMKHYGIATTFDQALDNQGKELVIQYEVQNEEILSCGGAYVKLLADGSMTSADDFDNETPYIIMFGPDRCGSTNKVHFILRHQNPGTAEWEEKHAQNVPPIKIDKHTNLYTLVLRSDNSFDIYVNGQSAMKGSLLEDMVPPIFSPEFIDDPENKKPEDWVDEAKIADPDVSKPDDWDEDAPMQILDMDAVKPEGWLDDEPDMVSDPEASMPEDWDEDEDGEWEAPLITNPKCEDAPGCGEWVRPMKANPEYKGKWRAPLVDNPLYKGEWKPQQIKNPAYFVDEHPHNVPKIGALAVEVWTTNGGIRFDNFLIGFDGAAALAYAEETWKPKFDAQVLAEEEAKKENSAKERNAKKLAGGWKNLAEVYVQEAMEAVAAKPYAALGTIGALLLSLIYLLLRPRAAPAAPAAKTLDEDEDADENDENEEEEEEEEEKEENEDAAEETKERTRTRSKSKKAE